MSHSSPHEQAQALERFRERIDALDHELIDVLVRRFDVVREIGAFKAREGMAVVQSERAQFVIDRAVEQAKAAGLDEAFARKLYEMLIDLAHEMQHEIVAQADKG